MNVNDRFLNCFLIEKNVTKDQSSNSFGEEILKNIKQIHHAIILLFCKSLKNPWFHNHSHIARSMTGVNMVS